MIKKKRSRWKPSKEEMSVLYNLCYTKDTDTVLTIEEDSGETIDLTQNLTYDEDL